MDRGETKRRYAPLGGRLIGLMAAVDVVILPFMFWVTGEPSPWIDVVFLAILIGQLCAVALISSLSDRSWLWGYARGLLVTCLGVAAVFTGLAIVEVSTVEYLPIFCFLPAVNLIVSLPLILLRMMMGWRLQGRSNPHVTASVLRLEDLFLIIAIAAAALMLLRVPQVMWETDPTAYLKNVLIAGSTLFGFGFLVLPPSAWFGLAARQWHVRLLGLLLISVVVSGVLWLVFPVNEMTFVAARSIPLASFYLIVFVEFYATLWLLRATGTTLVIGKRGVAARSEQTASAVRGRIWARCIVAVIVVLTGMISFSLARIEARRAEQDRAIARLNPIAIRTGGWLHTDAHKIMSLGLGKRATDEDVGCFAECIDLNYVDFSFAVLTDKGLAEARNMRQVEALFLNGTAISDKGLAALRGLNNLSVLGLQDTQITGRGLAHLSAGRLTQLELHRSRMDDGGCAILPRFKELTYLFLGGSRVTDDGLAHIGRMPQMKALDLNNTQITDAGLFHIASLKSLESLDLSGTNISGEGLEAIAGCKNLADLQLRHTSINDAGLLELSQLPILQLDVAGTRVTVAGLIAAGVPRDGFLFIGEGQFTRGERSALRRGLRSIIEVDSMDE